MEKPTQAAPQDPHPGAAAPSGAAAFLKACQDGGMDTCFANPGTTELAFVRAFDQVPGWHVVSAMFEGVCTGAADGYARMLGKPALTLTHLGPGFANGIANLHNARRAHSAIVNVIGDHTVAHLPYDSALTSDIQSLARPVSAAVHYLDDARQAGAVAHAAVTTALAQGGQIATVIFAADAQAAPAAANSSASATAAPPPGAGRKQADATLIAAAAARLRAARPLLLIGGDALTEAGLEAAQRIAAFTGARLYCETFPARIERGHDLPAPERFPYFPEPAFALVGEIDQLIVAGTAKPITYFGYPDYPSEIVPADKLLMLAGPLDAAAAALQALAATLGCPPAPRRVARAARCHVLGSTALDGVTAAQIIAAWLPDQAIVSVEGGTLGYPFFTASANAARHTALTNTGGAIGQGLPVGTGAGIACPQRRVVCVQSDGSAQYTVQSLWTMARERVRATIVIAANRRYAVLQNELVRDGVKAITGASAVLTSLDDPALDWVALARGYGVPGVTARSGAELNAALDQSLAVEGPFLIELLL